MILVVNNLRDIGTDSHTGKRTLGVIMGDRGTRAWYFANLAVAYAVPLIAALTLDLPGMALVALSIPWAYPLVRAIAGGTSGRALNPILKRTARFNLIFAVFLAIGIAIS